ncbi:hypothetical protein OsI_29343 [Oryza sativa Indica Group]|uniref:DYW domain-containing protein n=1 Tax=Oryza sativa subsp. indica TaxID=39946 RepID=A2YVI3_ORYSI|nr:hypothetical protein OsI_29343 [Oryza sativa Indica Group]
MASHLTRALLSSPPSSAAAAATASAAAALLSSTSPLPAARFLQLHAHLLRTGLLLLPLAPTAASAFLSLAAASLPSHRALPVLLHHLALAPETLPSTFRLNAILRSLRGPDALRFLRRARELGRRGNAFSLSIVLGHCRALAHARQLHANVVAEGHSPDALLATSLVSSYAACGDGDSARKVFDEMPVRDTIAWNVLITCYTRNRRTKDALKLFDAMRGGENGAEPDDVTCILLLQACTSLGALDFGEKVWEYAVDHGYGADASHPRKAEIYEKLDEINKHLRIAGYVPNVSSELHDLDSEGKECALAYHSEKLAIAFALLVTPQHRPIRLAKNLRVCVDCHNFTKVFSGVYHRLVIVRDRTRFHHFKEFQCSCNDYW